MCVCVLCIFKDQCVDANEQKQLASKQSSKLFDQHHQVHLVGHHGNEAAHIDAPTPSEATNETGAAGCRSLSPSVVCRNEKRGKRRRRGGRSGWTKNERRP